MSSEYQAQPLLSVDLYIQPIGSSCVSEKPKVKLARFVNAQVTQISFKLNSRISIVVFKGSDM